MQRRTASKNCRAASGHIGRHPRRVGGRTTRIGAAAALVAAWALSSSALARAEWLAGADAGAHYDSNLTQAQQAPDIRADAAAILFASGGYFLALTGSDGLTFDLSAEGQAWHRFHGLDQVLVAATAAYKHKFGVGYSVPWISLDVSLLHDNSRSAIRESNAGRASAAIGQRFTEAFDGSIGVVYDRRRASNDLPVVPGISGAVFDLRGHGVFARAAYSIDDRLQVGANVAGRRGDVVSTTRQNLAIFLASDAIAADPAFGDGFFAYRLKGTSRTATLSSSWALSDRASVNVGYTDDRTRAHDGLDYRGHVADLYFAYRY
jgi:hypothetical protein